MVDSPRPEQRVRSAGKAPGRRYGDTSGAGRAAAGRAEPLQVGEVVEDRFEIIERLGAGSLGVVYRVHDRTMAEDRALKAIYPAHMVSERARERFVTQVRVALRLAHPYIARMHDFGEDRARALQYVTMEYVRGASLERLMHQRAARLPLAQALAITENVAEALGHAHQITVHRDLKPQNIMVAPDGTVKVLDFALARLMTRAQFSQSAMVMGTAYYQAPEIHLRHHTVDQRADIFSLGVILYEMVTGRIPQGHFLLPTEIVPDAPRALNRLITRCLATAVEDRYDSAADLLDALRELAHHPGGRLASLVQAVRDRAASLPAFTADDDDMELASLPAEEPAGRFTAPTAVLLDRNAAEQVRQMAQDAMEQARAAGAEEHAARRFAAAREAFEEAYAPLAAGHYSVAIAEYEGVTRAFQKIVERVAIAKEEKTRLAAVVEALRTAKAACKTIVVDDSGSSIARARELELEARAASTRRDALALLEQALETYKAMLAGPGIDQDATVLQGDAEQTLPPAPAAVPPQAADVTLPARGPRVAAARVPSARRPPEPPSPAAAPPVEKAPAPEVETTVLLVPDHYPRIQAAIDAARTGSTVRIRPGVYEENLVLKNGIKVIGEDQATVIIRAPSGQASVVFAKNCRTGLVSGVTLEHRGSQAGNVRYAGIKLHRCSIGVFRCTIQNTSGSGVIIKAGGAPTIRECLIQDNPWPGIHVRDKESAPILKRNVCIRNGGRGIYFDRGAGGQAIHNECRENRGSGISIHDPGTSPELRLNTCTENAEYGMYFGHGAGGVAEENTCSRNRISGISVHDAGTAPMLRRNTCADNGNDGMYFGDAAAGVAEDNTCTRNKEDGIFVRDPDTAPQLIRNHCLGNRLRGIEFGFGAQGVADHNRCEQNAKEGIRASNPGTAPRLMHNECTGNGTRGIYYSKGAGGVAEGNVCEGNNEIGMAVAGQGTNPTLSRNRLERNAQYGLFIDKNATPILQNNHWAHNGIADLNDDRPV
jgi:parallel beta-helix repeat protein